MADDVRTRLVDELRHSGVGVLAAMAAVPPNRLEAPGYENGWTVRQIMAHVASMEFTYRRLPDVARGSRDAQVAAGGGRFDMDGYNARQVERRAGATLQQLIEEFANGRAALIVAVGGLDGALLATPIRSAGGVSGTLAQVIEGTAASHVRGHAADFARAAGAEPTAGQLTASRVTLLAAEAAALVDSVSAAVWLRQAAAGDWPAAGVTGHVVEMLPYWAALLAEAARQPGLVLGRELDAPERIGAVVEAEKLTPAEAAAALRAAGTASAERLSTIHPDGWQTEVVTGHWGRLSLADAADRLLIQHGYEHIEQLRAALD